MNNDTINRSEAYQPCRFCLDASCDPTGTLTEENDYSSISVGRTISSLKEYAPENSYNISIESGRGKPLRIAVTYWNEYGRNGHEVGVYEPKFCPECGRKLRN